MKNIESYIMVKPLTSKQAMLAVAIMIALESEWKAKKNLEISLKKAF